jgi:alkyl hydroperoxide reductase subunit AhpC
VLFSHPCDFTPVCTTEIEAFALKQPEFEKRHTRLIGLSVGNVSLHEVWVSDINSKLLQDKGTRINFPIVADDENDAVVAKKYNM